MGRSKYFLGIDVAHKNIVYFFLNEGMLWIFWRKHDFWGASLQHSNKSHVDLWLDDNHTLDNPGRYMRLIGKLSYLLLLGQI